MTREAASKDLDFEQLAEVWQAFAEAAANDPALIDFARGHRLCMTYRVRDAGMTFYLSFAKGQVSGGVGEPPARAHVQLAMSAETLDGLFLGQVDGTRATLSGRIDFKGSIVRGLSLQVVQSDLNRVYRGARSRILTD